MTRHHKFAATSVQQSNLQKYDSDQSPQHSMMDIGINAASKKSSIGREPLVAIFD
jgi:hypothetical protein